MLCRMRIRRPARRIGFTGTREGLTEDQRAALYELLCARLTNPRFLGVWWLHHGCCQGADAQAHRMGIKLSMRLIGHPPTDSKFLMPDMEHFTELRPAADYLSRNRHIVDETGELIACPVGPEELHGGTWSTVRYGRRMRRPITIIWPDGRIEPPKP